MSDKPKKKSGSIAIPFLVTIVIAMLIIGGAAYFIYQNIAGNKDNKIKEPTPRNGSYSVSAEDSHTILFILSSPESGTASSTFLVMRSVPEKKRILFIGVPSNSIYYSEDEGTQIGLKDTYERGGAQSAKELVEKMLGTEINKYMVFDTDTFLRVCDIFGSVNYPVDIEFNGYEGDGSVQTLSPSEILKYLTYNKFDGGETERSLKTATIISYMINGSDGDRIASSFDRYFAEIINAVPNTDITAVDYDKRKSAIKYMFNFGTTISIATNLDGTDAESDFIPSKTFIQNLPEEYFGSDKD